jgi:hypothetical protein
MKRFSGSHFDFDQVLGSTHVPDPHSGMSVAIKNPTDNRETVPGQFQKIANMFSI